MKRIGKRHIVIPDTQVKENIKTKHLEACGNYIVEKRPDTVVMLGDWADMPSLSTHKAKGDIEYENKRYVRDIEAAKAGMELMMKPILKAKDYNPKLVMILGNHEDRIPRLVKQEPKLQGVVSIDDLEYEKFGWKVVPFLQPIMVNGIMYCHYFVTGVYDKPISKASQLISKYHQSCIAGHLQGRDIAYAKHADGSPITSIIAGSFYDHDEKYLSAQSNNHWRGIYMLSEVNKGSFDEMAVSLEFLKRRYA